MPQNLRDDARISGTNVLCYHYHDAKISIYSTTTELILSYLIGLGKKDHVVQSTLPEIIDNPDWQDLKNFITIDGKNVYWHTAILDNPGFFAIAPHGNSVPSVPKVKYLLDKNIYFTSEEKLDEYLLTQFKFDQ